MLRRGRAALCLLAAVLALAAGATRGAELPRARDERRAIAEEAYVYFYPLVLMDVTRRQATNAPAGQEPGRGPMNGFAHVAAFPKADFHDVVRPNFDTLYSLAWLDLRSGPVVVSVPDTGGRYYVLAMLDLWSDVFAAPGKRTTGTKAVSLALTPPGWTGKLPAGVERIPAPTSYVWVVGRTETHGTADYDAVHRVQAGIQAVELADLGKPPRARAVEVDAALDMKTPPLAQVNAMPAAEFFSRAVELLRANPPHLVDQPILARMRRLGIEPGTRFAFDRADPEVQRALAQGAANGRRELELEARRLAHVVNGWQIMTESIGAYGANYLRRATIAMLGLGANLPEDAIYPLCAADSGGRPLTGAHRYVIRFAKRELPPVDAFWSLTLYDASGFPVANPLGRFALGDRDSLAFGKDGSLEIYVQSASPGRSREPNWLPAPKGPFHLVLRLYAPRAEALDGRWAPPPVMRRK